MSYKKLVKEITFTGLSLYQCPHGQIYSYLALHLKDSDFM